ncbi:MAG TPA: aspartyl protease family protein [Pirellulales bacterium]|jgi:hypothetical protein|nr:aspartyl protease family protein [Pirellulales bacterium]
MAAEMVTAAGDRISVRFLLDTGADRTALSAATLLDLGLPWQECAPGESIRGITGQSSYVTIRSVVEFKTDGT